MIFGVLKRRYLYIYAKKKYSADYLALYLAERKLNCFLGVYFSVGYFPYSKKNTETVALRDQVTFGPRHGALFFKIT